MLLLLKLTVTPLLVGGMSLAVRYWGPALAGIVMGLPWMTGPIVFLIGLERGPGWVATTAIGVQLGVVALTGYVVAYATLARRNGWVASVAVGTAAFAVSGWALGGLDLTAPAATALAALSLLIGYRAIPQPRDARPPGRLPWWDIPARMLATSVLVLVINLSSDLLGPTLSGIVATFPVIMTVIGTFTHAQWGGGATIVLFRAILLSLLSFVLFFLVVAETVGEIGLVQSYGLATLTSIVASTVLVVLRRWRRVA